jgi:protein involved in ribonucleotide reduction
MLVVYDSRTGNVEKFIKKIGSPSVRISSGLEITEPFVLVTYTTGFGLIPPSTGDFLKRCKYFMLGVASSGNRNWGKNFGKAADLISNSFNVPLLAKFELFGTDRDVENFRLGVSSLEIH